jgi:hypothetical protein
MKTAGRNTSRGPKLSGGGLDARYRPCCGQIDDDEAEFVEEEVSFQKKRVSV